MKKMLFILLLSLSLTACANDKPPGSTAPVPPPLNGTYSCEMGIMTFNGDKRTIVLDISKEMSEITGISEGKTDAQYVFLVHNEMYRYDKAETFRIIIDDTKYNFMNDFTQTDEDTIAIYLSSDSDPVRFERQ